MVDAIKMHSLRKRVLYMSTTAGHITLKPADIVLLIDTREQQPLDLAYACKHAFAVERIGLATGDYSVKGLEHDGVVVERKSLDDLVQCVGRERERFEAELRRMQGFRARLVLVEAPYVAIEQGNWRSRVSSAAVVGSIMRWQQWGVSFHFAATRQDAARYAANYLWLAARAEWERLREFDKQVRVGSVI